MTFEEFFIKKKIDLGLLKSRQPDLYDEFRLHFGLMGEKSFDHTKKYWFNRLRKDFLLRDEPVSILPKAEAVTGKPAASAPVTPASGAVAKPMGFKPRFKAGVPAPKAPEEEVPKPVDEAANPAQNTSGTDNPPVENPPAASKPIGFKPRFKAGTTAPKAPEEEAAKPVDEAANPAQNTSGTDNPPVENPPAPAKPLGFKPRFKAGVTNAKKDPPAENGV